MHDPCDLSTTDCHDEPTGGRRAFLRESLMAVAALAAVGVGADRLEAMQRVFLTGERVGDELRFPMPTADGATIDTANRVVIARYQGSVYAFDIECPHRGTDIEWQGENGRFFCPKHKSTFQPEGTLIGGKAERGLDRHPVRRDGDHIVVDTSVTIRSTDPEAWGSAKLAA
ncbi:MAG: Rieske (2Fe-2S) protein [Gemmatimonadaceae bacterium]|nr:Rieske (2Fe-2S) protein [Gemmatimonadaceae bacterium]